MESLEDRRLLAIAVDDLDSIVVEPGPQPVDPLVDQAAEISFHGADLAGKDGPLAPVGWDLTLLFHEYQQYQLGGGFGDFLPRDGSLQVRNNRVSIDVTAETNVNALRSQLTSIGMEVRGTTDRQVTGSLPISAIDDLAQLSAVNFARPAYKPIAHAGLVPGQGDVALQSDLARQKFAVDGTGITVGVISDSYNALADPAAPGTTGAALDQQSCNPFFLNDCDLPTGINVIADDPFGTDEGRAMLQIIHDVAPGAGLAFSTNGNSEVEQAEAVRRLRDAGADVIVDDIGFITEPFFEDGVISQAIDEVADDGVVYTSAAGNQGTNSYESAFVDSGVSGPLGTALHDFNPGSGIDPFIRVSVPFGTALNMALQWDQPFGSLHRAIIEAPCVNRSEHPTTIDGITIFLGFILVKDLEDKLVATIIGEREKNGPFKDLHDFIAGLLIEVSGWFVGQKDFRIGHQRTGDSQHLLLTSA